MQLSKYFMSYQKSVFILKDYFRPTLAFVHKLVVFNNNNNNNKNLIIIKGLLHLSFSIDIHYIIISS